ncbi:MAG: hypothetical protein AAFW87_10475 [Pseudomonadota bacterium]
MFKRIVTAALVFGAAAIGPPTLAQAQTRQCMPRDALVDRLQSQYGERPSGGGLQSPQQLLEVWSSQTSGSFTVFITQPNGMSCVVATGLNWTSTTAPSIDGVAS